MHETDDFVFVSPINIGCPDKESEKDLIIKSLQCQLDEAYARVSHFERSNRVNGGLDGKTVEDVKNSGDKVLDYDLFQDEDLRLKLAFLNEMQAKILRSIEAFQANTADVLRNKEAEMVNAFKDYMQATEAQATQPVIADAPKVVSDMETGVMDKFRNSLAQLQTAQAAALLLETKCMQSDQIMQELDGKIDILQAEKEDLFKQLVQSRRECRRAKSDLSKVSARMQSVDRPLVDRSTCVEAQHVKSEALELFEKERRNRNHISRLSRKLRAERIENATMNNIKGFVSGDDGDSDDKSPAYNGDDSSFKKYTIDDILQTLIRTAIKLPFAKAQVEHALTKVAQGVHLTHIFNSVFKIMESGSPGFRRAHRIVIYELLSSCLLSGKNESALSPSAIPSDSVKPFVMRLINDIDRSNCESITQSTLERVSKLVAFLSMSAFDDLVVRTLMSSEFVSGKPTIATTVVQDALVEIFANLLQKEKYAKFISEVIERIETVPGLRMNNEVIIAVASGFHRSGITLPLECLPSVYAIYAAVTESMTPESIEAALSLLSLVPAATISRKLELEESILVIGAKGLDNEDFRADFLRFVSLIWKHRLALFDTHTEELLNLTLSLDDSDVWAIGPHESLVPFLCSLEPVRTSRVLHALASIARCFQSNTPEELVEYATRSATAEGACTADEAVGILSLIISLEESVISVDMINFAEKLVLAPATAVAQRFPRGIAEADLVKVRAAAESGLITICLKSRDFRAKKLFEHLIDCLAQMPSAGIGTLCRSISLLAGLEGMTASIMQSRGFPVIVWLLFCIANRQEEPVEPVIECLVALVGHIHTSLSGLYDNFPQRLVRFSEGDFSLGDEFAFLIGQIEFESPQKAEDFFLTALDTCIALISASETMPRVKEAVILIWGEIMLHIVADQSVSLFSNRITHLLQLQDSVTASEGCVAATAKAVGRLAGSRLDAVLEILTRTIKQAELMILSQGAGNAISSVSNSMRIKANKTSFRGLFVFERSEKIISSQLGVRQIVLSAIGVCMTVCPENRLSEVRVKECLRDLLLNELKRDVDSVTHWLREEKINSTVSLSTTLAAVDSVAATSLAVARIEEVDSVFFEKFHKECLALLLQLTAQVCELPASIQLEPILVAISHLVSRLTLTQEEFTSVLSTTLHAIVHSVPDNPNALNAASEEAICLASRCSASASVVRALFGHSNSWSGFSRIIKAVFSLGCSGPLPLLRWVCVRIASAISEETDIISSDRDIEEFAETVATIIPRVSDSYGPVRDCAKKMIETLYMRAAFSKDEPNISKSLPDQFVASFVLHLVPCVHDADSAAAESVVDLIFNTLSLRSVSVFTPPESAADAVVDAILTNAGSCSSLSSDSRVRLISSLKFIAAVRFPIAIKEVLDDSNLSVEKVHAIHSFARDKTTLMHLIQDLLTRIKGDKAVQASAALGHVLDCYQDTGVCAITVKYFSEFFCSLLLVLWDCPHPDSVKLVLHKLCRAANVSALPDSVSTETGLTLLLEKNPYLIKPVCDFVLPCIDEDIARRTPSVVLAAQLMAFHFAQIDRMVTLAEAGGPELRFALKGIKNFLSNAESPEKPIWKILTIASNSICSPDVYVALEALRVVKAVAGITKTPQHVSYLMTVSFGYLRRVVDHSHDEVRSQAFQLLSAISALVSETNALETLSSDSDSNTLSLFFSAVSDLWIPCLVRSQEASQPVSQSALTAFITLIDAAFAEEPVAQPPDNDLDHLLSLVRSEISECSLVHLHSCAYYLLGLPSVSKPVMLAAASLSPILVELIPESSNETGAVLADLMEKLLTLGQTAHEIDPILSDVLVAMKRLELIEVSKSS